MRYRIGTATVTLSFVFTGLLALSACKPDYPACKSDDHCAEKGEVCVNGTCQECRDDEQCITKHGEGHECFEGRCEVKPECRADGDCAEKGEGLVCRSNACVPECTANEDCGADMKCETNRCVPAGCVADQECGPGMACVDGACEAVDATKVSAQCRPMNPESGDTVALGAVQFDFDKYDIRIDARDILNQNAGCLQEAGQIEIIIEGHCDERGTQEYNLALGEKRASAVRAYLRNMGVDPNRVRTRSKGENEPVCSASTEACYERNRRVEFIQVRR